MIPVETETEPDYRQETRLLLRQFLITGALMVLLVVLLAVAISIIGRRSSPVVAEAAPWVLAALIFGLLAGGAYRGWNAALTLAERFAGQNTLRQEQLDALRRRHFLLSATLSGVGDAVIAADNSGRITFLNPIAEKLTGWDEQDAMGREVKTVLSLVHEQTGAALPDPARAILDASVKLDFPPRAAQIARTGEKRPVTGSGTPIWEQHGKPGGVALVFRDVSDRRGAEDALGQVQDAALAAALAESRDKSALLANMSDELRTPLNAVIGYSEILQEEAIDRNQNDLVPDLQKINGAGKHLLSLINDILDLSKIEAGQMELYPETFDVAAMLKDVRETVLPILARNQNTLQVRAASGLGVMHADKNKIKQCLLNLLSNATGYAEGRIVTLDAGREHDGAGDWITFRLADTTPAQGTPGPALAASDAPRTSGHGLVLVIARHFCHMQGGEFTGSREPGRGAVYQMRFPA